VNPSDLISRLIQLEQAALKCDRRTIHALLLQVEEGVLQLEKLTVDTLRENADLRRQLGVSTKNPAVGSPSPLREG
jgi:hypothetical protein